jgi:50S ribosomal protein uL3
MIKEIYGKKIGMTQVFSEEGEQIPITLLQIDPVCILEKIEYQNKSMARIGCFKIEGKKADKVKKPIKGYFNKLDVSYYKLIREVEIAEGADLSFLANKAPVAGEDAVAEKESDDKTPETPKGSEVKEEAAADENKEPASQEDTEPKQADENKDNNSSSRYVGIEMFSEGDIVKVQAVTKGRGFAGGMKRYGWAGQPRSHGHTTHRRVGSVGASAQPSRIIKGLHMPGHMGNVNRTIKNLKIVKVDKDKNILFVSGSMPGAKGALVKLKKAKW